MATEYQASSNSNNDCDERFNETSEASLSWHSLSHTLSDQTTKFILPALRTWRTLPAEPLRLITEFAKHVHDYQKVFSDGPRDNNEYTHVCRQCGYYTFQWIDYYVCLDVTYHGRACVGDDNVLKVFGLNPCTNVYVDAYDIRVFQWRWSTRHVEHAF